MTLAAGIHMLGGLSPSAAYVVETSDGLVLVDSGLDGDAGRLKSQMAELRLDWTRVRAIFLTHAHGDHTGGAEALRKATGAQVYAGAGDAAVLRAGGPREAFFSTFYMPNNTPHPTAVDVELRGGETFEIGGVRIEAIACAGPYAGEHLLPGGTAGPPRPFRGGCDHDARRRGSAPPTSRSGRSALTRPTWHLDTGAMPEIPSRRSATCSDCRSPTWSCPAIRAPIRPAISSAVASPMGNDARPGHPRHGNAAGPLRGRRRRLPRRQSQGPAGGPLLPGRSRRLGRLRILRRVAVLPRRCAGRSGPPRVR